MPRWIVWVALEAPDRETARRMATAALPAGATIDRLQSAISYQIQQEELPQMRQRRPARGEDDA